MEMLSNGILDIEDTEGEEISLTAESPQLTEEERFDLYYEEHCRVQEEKNSMSYDELLRKSGLKPPTKN